jgi:hypothetical protein
MVILTRRHESSSIIAGVLLFALFTGGLPSFSGVTIIGTGGPPAFTADICHPQPGLNHGSGFSPAPLNGSICSNDMLPATGAMLERLAPFVTRLHEAPDPPPPKSPR